MTSMKVPLLALACFLVAPSASAQKSADNLRIAVTNTMAVLSQYVLPTEEASTFYNRVWESLIAFQGKRAEYFGSDPIILKAMHDGLRETGLAKREEIYRVAFDRIAEMRYVLPISSLPSVYAHSKDVAILGNLLSAADEYIGDFAFK